MNHSLLDGDIPPSTLPDMEPVSFPRDYWEHWRAKSLERGRRAERREGAIRCMLAVYQIIEFSLPLPRRVKFDGPPKESDYAWEPACPACHGYAEHGHYESCILAEHMRIAKEMLGVNAPEPEKKR